MLIESSPLTTLLKPLIILLLITSNLPLILSNWSSILFNFFKINLSIVLSKYLKVQFVILIPDKKSHLHFLHTITLKHPTNKTYSRLKILLNRYSYITLSSGKSHSFVFPNPTHSSSINNNFIFFFIKLRGDSL